MAANVVMTVAPLGVLVGVSIQELVEHPLCAEVVVPLYWLLNFHRGST